MLEWSVQRTKRLDSECAVFAEQAQSIDLAAGISCPTEMTQPGVIPGLIHVKCRRCFTLGSSPVTTQFCSLVNSPVKKSFFPKIVALTGAGISAESGLPTFRGAGGLWQGYRVEEVANPNAFRNDPELVHAFYNWRRKALQDPKVQPNRAHYALAELERVVGLENFFLVTQNVDDLHERAGSQQVHHIHGELLKVRCTETGETWSWRDDLTSSTPHPARPERCGTLRPHIVWFGEQPLNLPEVYGRLQNCDLFLAIGTSGLVYPAAGFVDATPKTCQRFELNLDDTPISSDFQRQLRGPASDLVPALVERLKQQWQNRELKS